MTAATETTPALLRRAADRLDDLAGAATPGPWKRGGIGDFGWSVHMGPTAVETEDSQQGNADAAYIAAADPGVGATLVLWLRTEAASTAGDEDHGACLAETCTTVAAMVAARKILGEAS